MTMGHIVLICAMLSAIAMVFSWITIATEDWRFYIPTVLFAALHFGLAGYALFIR